MSELNNNKKDLKTDNVILDDNLNKNTHPIKNIIIFLFVYAALCVSATAFLIYRDQFEVKNQNVKVGNNQTKASSGNKKNSVKKEVSDCEGLKSRDVTYDLNDLKINEIEEHDGDKIIINYFEIDGLKDKNLQREINKRIKDTVYGKYTNEEKNNDEISQIYISANCSANFSNVLSVGIYKNIGYYDPNKLWDDENDYISINLVDGKDLQFEELFVKDAPIKNILSQAAYEAVAWTYPAGEDEWITNDISKKNYSAIEEEVFAVMTEYNSLQDVNFGFSNRAIYVNLRNYTVTIYMPQIYDQIAIFNRYKDAKDIYDGTYENLKNLFIFSDEYRDEGEIYHRLEKVSDSLLVNIVIRSNQDQKNENLEQELLKYKKEAEDKIARLKNSNDGKARFIYMDITGYYMTSEDDSNPEIYVDSQEFEMSKEYYDSEFYTYILDKIQIESEIEGTIGHLYVENFSKNMKNNVKIIEDRFDNLQYDFETNTFH